MRKNRTFDQIFIDDDTWTVIVTITPFRQKMVLANVFIKNV